MARRINGDNHDDLLLYGALAVGAFIAGSAILKKLGITQSDSSAIVQAVNNSAPSANPFNVNFGLAYNQVENDGDTDIIALVNAHNISGAQALALKQLKDADSTIFSQQAGADLVNVINAAEQINDAIGYLSNDVNAVNAAFGTLASQYDVSRVAQYLSGAYQLDLWTLLNNGRTVFNFGSAVNVAPIVQHVQALPVYPPAWGVN